MFGMGHPPQVAHLDLPKFDTCAHAQSTRFSRSRVGIHPTDGRNTTLPVSDRVYTCR